MKCVYKTNYGTLGEKIWGCQFVRQKKYLKNDEKCTGKVKKAQND